MRRYEVRLLGMVNFSDSVKDEVQATKDLQYNITNHGVLICGVDKEFNIDDLSVESIEWDNDREASVIMKAEVSIYDDEKDVIKYLNENLYKIDDGNQVLNMDCRTYFVKAFEDGTATELL